MIFSSSLYQLLNYILLITVLVLLVQNNVCVCDVVCVVSKGLFQSANIISKIIKVNTKPHYFLLSFISVPSSSPPLSPSLLSVSFFLFVCLSLSLPPLSERERESLFMEWWCVPSQIVYKFNLFFVMREVFRMINMSHYLKYKNSLQNRY